MGPTNLAAIKRAAEKLQRLDPDYTERMKRNRHRRTRAQQATLSRQLNNALKHLLTRSAVERIDPNDDTTNVDEQDDTLLFLAANDNAATIAKEKRSVDPKMITLGAETLTISQWSEKTGIPSERIRDRLYRGYSAEKVLSPGYLGRLRGAQPLVTRAKRYEANGESNTIFEWAIATRINEGTIRSRVKAGWPFAQVISLPIGSVMGRSLTPASQKLSHTANKQRILGGASEQLKKASGPVGLVYAIPSLNRDFDDDR